MDNINLFSEIYVNKENFIWDIYREGENVNISCLSKNRQFKTEFSYLATNELIILRSQDLKTGEKSSVVEIKANDFDYSNVIKMFEVIVKYIEEVNDAHNIKYFEHFITEINRPDAETFTELDPEVPPDVATP